MGYEVLDADGTGRAVTPTLGAPTDVVALDDLPDPQLLEREAPRKPRRRPPWLVRLLSRVSRDPGTSGAHPWRWVGSLSAVALTIGLVVGLVWSGHHADQVRLAAARGTVSALATLNSVDRVPTSEGPAADFSIRVYNVGSMPLRVKETPHDLRLTYTSPQVSLSSGSAVVQPRSSQTIITRVLLDCDKTDPMHPLVTVQPPDGSSHRLTVTEDAFGGSLPTAKDLCNQLGNGQSPLDVNLGGTLAHPTLLLHNTTRVELTASWMYDVGSGGFAPDRRDVQLTSEPALPLTLGPHEQRTIALRIIVHGCGTNKPLEEYQGLGYMNLQAQFGNAPNDDQTQPVSGVDLSAVVGAALQRSCG